MDKKFDLSALMSSSSEYLTGIQEGNPPLPSLSFLHREAESDIEATVYVPNLCLILQGSKIATSGKQSVELRPGDALLVSHDLPVISRITQASVREPYLAIVLSLDLRLIRSLYDEVTDELLPQTRGHSLAMAKAEPTWAAPLARYLDLKDNPMDAKVLGPQVLREIHYRLLLSPIGRMLQELLVADSHASRIAKAIKRLRNEFRSPLRTADLAKESSMSASSFHEHFKAVTGTSPLQYQKDLRLIEARALLSEKKRSVAEAAFSVGYESQTHFSRDYKRRFGSTPSQHMAQ